MPDLTETLTTVFRADTTHLVDGMRKASSATAEHARKELRANREVEQAMAKAAKARADLIGNTRGSVLDPGGAAVAGLNKFVAAAKFSAFTTGALSAGINIASDAITKFREDAANARVELEGLSEGVRKLTFANTRVSAGESSSGLLARLGPLHEAAASLQQQHNDLDPQTRLGKAALAARYYSNYGLKPGMAMGMLQIDRRRLDSQQELVGKQIGSIAGRIPGALGTDLAITRERLSGSPHQARIMELKREQENALSQLDGTDGNTPENRKKITDGKGEEIAAEQELIELATHRYRMQASNLGVERSLRTEEEKRVKLAENNLAGLRDELATHEHMNEDARRALNLDIIRGETELRNARMENDLAHSRQSLAQKVSLAQSSNLSTSAKTYKAEQLTLTALRDQLAAVKDVNTAKAQGLSLTIAENENRIRELRQDTLYNKNPSEIQKSLQAMQQDERKRDQFDANMTRTAGGLLRPDKDINGNITGGTDPITGEYRAANPGEGLAERGLTSGHVGDHTVPGGGRSRTRDKDPFGGLSGGSTPRMFMESDAAKFLRDAPSAEKALDASRMDPARNPALRLAQKQVFGPRSHSGSTVAVQHAKTMVDQQVISNGHLLKMVGQLDVLTQALPLR